MLKTEKKKKKLQVIYLTRRCFSIHGKTEYHKLGDL